MIELRTGLPGNGKTLSMVQELAAMQVKWDKGDESARPVFVHNVKDLILPHSPLPVIEEKNPKTGGIKRLPDWDNVPDGSLVIIDECQDLFPPRSSQSEAPPHVAWLNTHRHRGVDLVLITQHPKLIDSAVRALVGKHKHYRRMFGSSRSVVYEWDGCADSLTGMKNAVTTYWKFPADAFKWYKSAEVHTKQKFKLPMWMGIPLVGLVLMAFFVPRAYSVLVNGVQGKEIAQESKPHIVKKTEVSENPLAQGSGAIAPAPAAPMAPVTLPISLPEVPRYKGCITDPERTRCSCLTEDDQIVKEPPMCREYV
jgi:zona occludens toxin